MTDANHDAAIELAAAALAIRGFGHVKEAAAVKAQAEEQRLPAKFEAAGTGTAAGVAPELQVA